LSRPATLGNVKHTFAEHVIRSFNESVLRTLQRRPAAPSQQAINAFVQESRAAHVAELYAVGASDAQIDAELRGMVGPLWHWLTGTLGQSSGVRRSQTVPARNRPPAPSSSLQLDHVVGTEENIWSPVFGLKGQIDVTAVTNAASLNEPRQSGLSPLELKTGKRRDYVLIPHKAQVMLYLLLLQTRVQHTQYARVGKEGFLVYLSNDGVACESVLPVWDELRSLMIARNRCALSARGPSSGPLRYDSPLGLPPVIRQPNDCQRCYQAAECMLYHAASENGTAQSSGVPDLFQQIVEALSPEHLSYFRHWDRLIELESTTGASSRPELWTLDGVQRENGTAKCIGGLICEGVGQDLVTGDALLTLTRHAERRESAQLPLKELPFAPGDRVIVSLDGHRTTARDSDGLVDLEDCRVTAVGHPLGYGVHLFVANVSCINDHTIQLRASDLPEHLPRWIVSQGGRGPKLRVDKDELSTGVATMRSNLAQMLIEPYQPPRSGPAAESTAQPADPTDVRQASATKLRSLVVELRPPRYNHMDTAVARWFANPPVEAPCRMGPNGEQYRLGYPTVYPGCAPQQLVQELQALNPDQRAAIHKVLSAEDYALLLGMPGTGKTSTIACLVRTLVARGATVLLSSYTHSAVDNMLQKLVDAGVVPGMALRIGSKHQTPPHLHPYLLESQGVDTIARLAEIVESSRIVAVTCLGIRHPIFSKKRFDVCILDEAGQAPQPAALGPLLSADKFVLVGDHYQVRSPIVVLLIQLPGC
jgi:DNA replication ATP-dependent helicase Dna2